MKVRIDIACHMCFRSIIDTIEVPDKVMNLHVCCKECDEEAIVDFPKVHCYGRSFGDGLNVTVRVDKL